MAVSTRLKVKRGDTAPQFRAQCLGGTDRTPVDLTGATAKLLLRRERQPVVTLPLVVDTGGGTGWVKRDWDDGDLAEAGVLHGEVEVVFADGRKQTFPADGYVTIEIVDDLNAPT